MGAAPGGLASGGGAAAAAVAVAASFGETFVGKRVLAAVRVLHLLAAVPVVGQPGDPLETKYGWIAFEIVPWQQRASTRLTLGFNSASTLAAQHGGGFSTALQLQTFRLKYRARSVVANVTRQLSGGDQGSNSA